MRRSVFVALAMALAAAVALDACSGANFTTVGDAGVDVRSETGGDACAPKLCPQLGWACGKGDDGCGGAIDCGSCTLARTTCVNHKCMCSPETCAGLGAHCGMTSDGCGGTLDCGSCTPPAMCGGGGDHICGANMCTPMGCQPGQCGTMSDGCGGTMDCGSCTPPATCGGGGMNNLCGCMPLSCAQLGYQCGTTTDNCGNPLDCGGCPTGTCDPMTHQCGACVPTTTCQNQGWMCGSFVDECRAVQTCGPTPVVYTSAVCTMGGTGYACLPPAPGPTPPEPAWSCTTVSGGTSGTASIWCCSSTN